MGRRIVKSSKSIYLSFIIVIFLVGLTCSLTLLISYENAKMIAVKYLKIVNYNKETFQSLKAELYDKVTPDVQELLFSSGEYKGVSLPPIYYIVNSVRGNIVGFNHYVFRVNWTVNHTRTIDSIICIKDNVVYDTYRAE
jgi:hypothetical protein